MRKTATIERYHVWGTPNYCLALWNKGRDYTPTVNNCPALQEWVPDDADGIERLKKVARAYGFTHAIFSGDWGKRTKPKGGAL